MGHDLVVTWQLPIFLRLKEMLQHIRFLPWTLSEPMIGKVVP